MGYYRLCRRSSDKRFRMGKMKTTILAGGFGTRLGGYTEDKPKPMVEIGGKPIIWHIMKAYQHYGFIDFYIALGYKGAVIERYFNLPRYFGCAWYIDLIDTGKKTMTGGRIKRLEYHIGKETFMATYGDGVANINIKELVEFHKSHGKIGTVTAVHPPARFGELKINKKNIVKQFKEKPQVKQGWINGGFFVFEPEFFDYIKGDDTVLEEEPLENLARDGQLMAYKHRGFWHCMDTKRDLDVLNNLWNNGEAEWKVW